MGLRLIEPGDLYLLGVSISTSSMLARDWCYIVTAGLQYGVSPVDDGRMITDVAVNILIDSTKFAIWT